MEARFSVPDKSFSIDFPEQYLIKRFNGATQNFSKMENGNLEDTGTVLDNPQRWTRGHRKNIKSIYPKEDPSKFGYDETHSAVNLTSVNEDRSWSVGVYLDNSILLGTDLFLSITAGHAPVEQPNTFEDKFNHISVLTEQVFGQIGTTLEVEEMNSQSFDAVPFIKAYNFPKVN